MGIKLTQQKQASEEAAAREHKRFEEEVERLTPMEKMENDIKILKSWETNVNYDIKHMGNSNCLNNKLSCIKNQITEKTKELEEMRKKEEACVVS